VLITDHNVRETLDIVDRACIIYGGQVLFAGSPKRWWPIPTCAASIWARASRCEQRARASFLYHRRLSRFMALVPASISASRNRW
jgi:ABC-type multidrug transport system ATPase subunit